MKLLNIVKNRKSLLLASLMGSGMLANAQLKVGDNPTSIQKSAVLELESTRQGLLLPRLSDTAAINSLNPPDGMIIYLTADHSLRIRSNNAWKKLASMADAAANWSLTGNNGTDSATSFIGTTDGKPFTIKTDNAARMTIGSNGNIGIGTTTPSATLNVNGTVKLENLAANSTEVDVLVLAADGAVYKRTMSSSAFTNAIKSINGIQKQTLSITAAASTSEDSVKVDSRSSDSTIAIYLPVQDGASANKPYGFLTRDDWSKIQSGIQTITIGAVAASSDVNGATIVTDSTSRKIILHPADAANPGIVTTGTQTFGGNKSFQDSVAATKTFLAGAAGSANSTVQVAGSISMAIKSVTASYSATAGDNTILANTTTQAFTITLPAPATIAGRIYTIKKVGSGGIDKELTISPTSGTIDGGSSYVIYNDWTYVTLQTDGTDWYIIKK